MQLMNIMKSHDNTHAHIAQTYDTLCLMTSLLYFNKNNYSIEKKVSTGSNIYAQLQSLLTLHVT